MGSAPENAERQAGGWHKLRAGREKCTARRRDGQTCEAPAVPGALICRRHGGGAPQVKIAAQRRQLQMALWTAHAGFGTVRGKAGQFECPVPNHGRRARPGGVRGEVPAASRGASLRPEQAQPRSLVRCQGCGPMNSTVITDWPRSGSSGPYRQKIRQLRGCCSPRRSPTP